MGTPVICPHCSRFFVSDNEPGNPFCLCPECGRWMNIAPPVRRRRPRPAGPTKCPFCGTQMAPGSDTCLKCQRQIITGEKLPLLRRLALMPTGRKMITLCAALATLVAVVVIINLIAARTGRPSRPGPGPTPVADSPEAITGREILTRLLASTDEPETTVLGNELGRVGPAIVGPILEALDDQGLDEGIRRALIAALGEIGDARAADVVARAMDEPRFRHTAMISLALIGDPRAARPMTEYFTEQVRRATLCQALVKRSLITTRLGPAALQREWAERITRSRRPVAALGVSVLPRLLVTFWSAWHWPARDRGSAWLDQVARIASQMTPQQGSVNDALEDLLTGQPADVRLAAALLLSRRRADGRRAAERWAGQLVDLLADRRLDVRQRTVWTMAAITGKPFGRFGSDRPPTQVPPAALTEASEWILRRTGRRVRIDASLLEQHRPRPPMTRRTYHPARVAARRSIKGLAQADWPTARARWQALTKLPPDASPAVRTLLEGDVRQLKVPARLVVLQLLAQWRDRASVRLMGRLNGLLDNPSWMPACVAVAQTSAAGDGRTKRWLDLVAGLDPDVLAGKDPDRGLVPADLGRLIAPQGRAALAAIHRDARYRGSGASLVDVYRAAVDAMIDYGWPVSVWLKELGGR